MTSHHDPDGRRELVAAWEQTLDALESDAQAAARLSGSLRDDDAPDVAAATPGRLAPTPGGPLPVELADRVRELLHLQARVAADLARSMAETRAGLADLGRRSAGAHRQPAAYVDVSA